MSHRDNKHSNKPYYTPPQPKRAAEPGHIQRAVAHDAAILGAMHYLHKHIGNIWQWSEEKRCFSMECDTTRLAEGIVGYLQGLHVESTLIPNGKGAIISLTGAHYQMLHDTATFGAHEDSLVKQFSKQLSGRGGR